MSLGGIGAGIGSGLDIRSIVDALVNAEKAPKEAQLNRLDRAATSKISALGQFRSALSTFQTALKDLNSASLFQKRSAASANPEVFTATAGSRAVAGNYDVTVSKLAQGSKVSLAAVDSSSSEVGTGKLVIGIGSGESLEVDIPEGKGTLADIRNAINAAGKDKGLSATIVSDPSGAGGARLILSSTRTGEGNDITVTAEPDSPGGLSVLDFSPATTGTGDRDARTLTTASDAVFSVDGIRLTSASNTIDNVIDGVSLTLKAEQVIEPPATERKAVSLAVSEDREAVKGSITSFVDAYNKLLNTVNSLTRVTPGAGDGTAPTTGALVGDSTVRTFMNTLRVEFGGQAEGELRVLADLGISTERNGTLRLDSAKLDKVLETGVDKVAGFLAGEQGLMTRLESRVKPYTETGGLLENRTKSLENTRTDVRDQREALARRTASLESRLLAQFNAMDKLVGQLSGTSNYLTGVLDSLPGVVKKSK